MITKRSERIIAALLVAGAVIGAFFFMGDGLGRLISSLLSYFGLQ